MNDFRGINYLRRKLNTLSHRVQLRYNYYEMKREHIMPEVSIPLPVSRIFKGKLGWCTKAVDNLADRLVVKGFSNDVFNMGDIYSASNPDILFNAAILGALITSCDFIYIMPSSNGELPKMQVIDGYNATGIIDPVTMMLKEGYAVIERDPETGSPLIEAYFQPGQTVYYYHDKKGTTEQVVHTGIDYCLLIPVIYKPDSKRPFGHSRISRTCMDLQDKAEDTLTRINVLSEISSWPQKYVLGLSDTVEGLDRIKVNISSILRFDRDEDGQIPSVGQFQQMSMTPHVEAFRLYANNFSGETGLTVDDLGFVSDNPSSAEAIKASHENLRLAASKAQSGFAIGFLNAGFTAACLRDKFTYKRSEIARTKVEWKPIIEPDASMLSSIGDGAGKINQAIPGFFTAQTLSALTGIETEDLKEPQGSVDDFIQELLGSDAEGAT